LIKEASNFDRNLNELDMNNIGNRHNSNNIQKNGVNIPNIKIIKNNSKKIVVSKGTQEEKYGINAQERMDAKEAK